MGGSCGAVDFPAAPHDVVGSPAGLSRLSGDEGTTEGAQLEAAIGWDRGGETRRHGNQSWALARMSSLELLSQIVGCRKLLLQGLELSDGESGRAGSKAAVLGRRRAFVGALCMVSRRAWRDRFLLRVLLLGVDRLVRHPRSQRRRGTRDWHRKHHGIKNQTISTSIRKIKSPLAPLSLSLASDPSQRRAVQLIPCNLNLTLSGKPALPATPLVVLRSLLPHSQPPTLLLSPWSLPSSALSG